MVLSILIRPAVLFAIGYYVFSSYNNDPVATAVFAFSILALIFSVAFIVIKFEEASYLVKVHYPFLLSAAYERNVNRRVMFDIFQSLKEECAILSILFGSSSDVFVFFGSLLLIAVGSKYDGWAAAVGVFILLAAIYSLTDYSRRCTAIMVSDASSKKWYKYICCLCFKGLKEENYQHKSTMDINNILLPVADSARFSIPSENIASEFRSAMFKTDFELANGMYNWKAIQDSVPDISIIDKENKPVLNEKDEPCTRKLFRVVDRYGILSIPGDAYLTIMKRKDAVAFQVENDGPESEIAIWYQYLNCLFSNSLSVFCMYSIALAFAWCEGLSLAMKWLVFGFDFESHFFASCKKLSGDMISNDEFSSSSLSDQDKSELSQESFRADFFHRHIVAIDRPMPLGLACLSPIINVFDCVYKTVTICYPPNCFGRKPAVKYVLNSSNLLHPHQVADILLHSDMFIPHELARSFPFTIQPFQNAYENYYISIAIALQVIVDSMEAHWLKYVCHIESMDIKNQKDKIKNIIMDKRKGALVNTGRCSSNLDMA